jgi:hypothetical protein
MYRLHTAAAAAVAWPHVIIAILQYCNIAILQ